MKKKVNSLIQVKKVLSQERKILTSYGISKIGVFGSFAYGDFNPKSDVDVLINLSNNSKLSLLDLIEIENDLSTKLGRKVDLVTQNGLRPYIKESILKSTVYV